MSVKGPVFPVAFDELATAEDLARLGGPRHKRARSRSEGSRSGFAFGVRHQPPEAHALSGYQIADRRLNG
jgi:hypothetical protein